MSSAQINNALIDLAHAIGEFIQYWGFKKVHGQIWTLLYLSKSELTAQDLVQKLGVSKALVSQSLDELENYNVIERIKTPGKKKVPLKANPLLFKMIQGVLKQREFPLIKNVLSAFLKLVSIKDYENDINAKQSQQLHEFIELSLGVMNSILNFKFFNFENFKNLGKLTKNLNQRSMDG